MTKTGDRLAAIESLKTAVIKSGTDARPIVAEQWDKLMTIAEDIVNSCRSGDLGGVAAATRKMKNHLRKRQFRRRLEALEAVEDEKKRKGECKCASCGAVIEGSPEPCIDGALCTACALKKGVKPEDVDNKKKGEKKDSEKENKKDMKESSLRRRRF